MSEIKGNDVELYLHSAQYAREHGELDAYRASYRANIACKDAITAAINENYHDNRLNSAAASPQVGEKFSQERIVYVLANTVQHKCWDGRISRINKAWAETIPVCTDIDSWQQDRNIQFVIEEAHPGLVDLFITHVRKELEQEKDTPDSKPSVLAKLKDAKAPSHDSSAVVKPAKEAER